MLGPVFSFPVLRILNSLSKFFVWRFTHKHSIFVCLCPRFSGGGWTRISPPMEIPRSHQQFVGDLCSNESQEHALPP